MNIQDALASKGAVINPGASPRATARQLLDSQGLRHTHARLTVLETLVRQPNQFLHPADILRSATHEGEYLTICSTYRQLTQLTDAGILQREFDARGTVFSLARKQQGAKNSSFILQKAGNGFASITRSSITSLLPLLKNTVSPAPPPR